MAEDDDVSRAAREDVERKEAQLVELTQACGYQATRRVQNPDGTCSKAALQQAKSTKNEEMPKLTALVPAVVGGYNWMYAVLSGAAHGLRLATFAGATFSAGADDDGRHEVTMSGFGVPPELAIVLVATSCVTVADAFATWFGADPSRVQTAADAIVA